VGAIGIDVEYCEPHRHFAGIAAATFGESEYRAVARGGAEAFYKIWTLREALAKASGLGFAQLVDGRDYFADTPSTQVWRGSDEQGGWVFGHRLLSATYAAAFAIKVAMTDARGDLRALLSMTNSNENRLWQSALHHE
jgi:4'-phosphopantetheinyl transferase